MSSDLPHKIQEIQIAQPVRVIDHKRLIFPKFNKATHLLLEALTVVIDLLDRHHGSQIRSPGGIPDHCGSPADQSNWTIPAHLQALHQSQGHKMPYMQGICRRIKADIKGRSAMINQIFDSLFIRQLRNQPSGH